MPKQGQKYAPVQTFADAVEEFGKPRVLALGRVDNLRKRGITAAGQAILLRQKLRDGGIISRLDPVASPGRPVPALLRPPEGAMEDATFTEAWRIVSELWVMKRDSGNPEPWTQLLFFLRLLHGAIPQAPKARGRRAKEDRP